MIAHKPNTPLESPVHTPNSILQVQQGEFNLFSAFDIVKRQYGLIIFGVIFALLFGGIYCYKAERLYESKMTLSVVVKNSASLSGQVPDLGGYYTAMQDSMLSTQLMILQTKEELFEETCQALKDRKSSNLASLYAYDDKEMVSYLKGNVEVSKGGEGKNKNALVLTISYKSPSPEESALVVGTLAGKYITYVNKTYSSASQDMVKSYEDQIAEKEEYRIKTQEELNILSSDAKKNDFAAFNEQGMTEFQQIYSQKVIAKNDLQMEIDKYSGRLENLDKFFQRSEDSMSQDEILQVLLAGMTDKEKDAEMKFLNMIVQLGTGEALKSAMKVQVQTSERNMKLDSAYRLWLEKTFELAALRRDLGVDNKQILKLQDDIETLKEMINEIKGDDLFASTEETIKTNVDLLRTYHGYLKKSLELKKSDLNNMNLWITGESKRLKELLEYNRKQSDLNREIDETLITITSLKKSKEDQKVYESSGGVFIDTLAKPHRADHPCWPNIPAVMGIAILLGTLFGTGLAYLVDLTDRTFHSPLEIGNIIGAPILAQLPKLHFIQRKRKWLRSSKNLGVIADEVVAYHRPKSRESETFRGLRTSLLVGLKLNDHAVVQVGSANPHDGKTTLATNLAVSVASSKRKVLLVDCDLRSPNLHLIFGIANGNGLSNYLQGECKLSDIVIQTPAENLTLITAGTNRLNPAEALSSSMYRKFLDEARQHYDLIVIDTPPVLAVADACITAPESDAVLLSVRVVKNGRPSVLHASHLLRDVGANLCGVVINNFKSHRFYNLSSDKSDYSYGNYGYGYGYTYGYSYGSDVEVTSGSKSNAAEKAAV